MTRQILIVDDEEQVREVIRYCLEDIAGWDVLTAKSGLEGLEIVRTIIPDAIILDMMMPGMDGLMFLQKLQNQRETRSIPVVLLTAKAELTDADKVSHLGVAGAVLKPFEPVQLVKKLVMVLG